MQGRGPLLTRRSRSTAGDLEALRKLVVGPEQVRLDKVEKPTPSVIGSVLPEAVSHAMVARPDELATTLEKPVTTAVQRIARRDPAFFGEILAPVVGTAVRRAVADALNALAQRINEIVETRMSVRSMRWRLEARRTGRPYAEIVLAHTLVYRVEWAVLIDTRSSLVLAQASGSDSAYQAPDQTAAMLAAIHTFVSDAMRPASPGAALHTIEVGDLSLWIERQPMFTVALALRGVAPLALRDEMRAALERVHALHGEPDALVDAAVFEDAQPLLVDLMKHEVRRPPRRAPAIALVVGCVVAAAIALAMARSTAHERRDVRLRAAYRDSLAFAPGLVVTSVERETSGRYRIRGLRDPRGPRPELIIAASGLPPAAIELAPFESADPRFPPAERPLVAVHASVAALEALGVEFARGEPTTPIDATDLARAADAIATLERAATGAQLGVCVEVLGDSDEFGHERINGPLRAARAASVVHALEQLGVRAGLLVPRAGDPLQTRAGGRRVTFRADLRPAPGGCR